VGYHRGAAGEPSAQPAADRNRPGRLEEVKPVARPTPARFYVNSGLVSSRADMHNLLRPLEKQAVGYRYYRGGDLVASGFGFVERVLIDEPETSSYLTPVSICLNVDSFEHLDFETRPDRVVVYCLVQGDERIVLEPVPAGGEGTGSGEAPGQLAFDTSGYVQMELPDADGSGD